MSPEPARSAQRQWHPERRLVRRLGVLAAAAALVSFALVLATAAPAAAQTGERITSYDVDMRLDETGTLAVAEVIDYQFPEGVPKQGIFRFLPERVRYDDRFDRLYDYENIEVSAEPIDGTGDAAPAGAFVTSSDDNGNLVIRIGTEGNFITGTWRYTIRYDVPHTVEPIEATPTRAAFDELAWNVVGTGWQVPIDTVDAAYTGPGPVIDLRCFAGAAGSTNTCADTSVDGASAAATATGLGPFEGMTLGVAMPPGTVPGALPVLEERWSFERAFEVTPLKAGLAGGLSLLGVAVLGLLLGREARDRRLALNAYLPTDAEPEREGLVGFFEKADGPVRFRAPEGSTPGLVGVIIDEKADTLDVTATVVDLAVRGYLRIEELGKDDFRFVRLREPDDDLLPYEGELLRRLWRKGSGGVVDVDDLKEEFHTDLEKVKEALYEEVMKRRWFVRRPDHVRQMWIGIGVALLAVGGAIGLGLAVWTKWGLLAIPALVPGIVVLVSARNMPARTAKGRRVLEEAVGYERFLDVADADQLRFLEQRNEFVAGLPYAMVFGLTRKWAETLAVLQEQGYEVAPTWYVPAYGHAFQFALFGNAMANLTRSTGQAFATTPASSSGGGFGGSMGGFSGGGGGGGGGGSW